MRGYERSGTAFAGEDGVRGVGKRADVAASAAAITLHCKLLRGKCKWIYFVYW